MVFPWQRRPRHDKIFINYRRDDAGGFAGRLSDSLTAHFGGDRVFRDVTGIDYGSDFERVIDERVAQSCAVVVLIGERWTSVANAEGLRRLDDPDDYVCREIAAALRGDAAVVPVLIGDAAMPRRDELPAALAPLIKRNAITITDERWDFDVARLAKVLAIDVPGSMAQQRLDLLKTFALLLLGGAALLSIVLFCVALGRVVPPGHEIEAAGFPPLAAAFPFVAILIAGALTLMGAASIEERRRRHAWSAVLLAAGGTLVPFLYYVVNNDALPAWSLIAMFGASTGVIVGMLALMVLAGFRAK